MHIFLYQLSPQILSDTISDKAYIFYFNFKNSIENQKFHFSTKVCEIRNKRSNEKLSA